MENNVNHVLINELVHGAMPEMSRLTTVVKHIKNRAVVLLIITVGFLSLQGCDKDNSSPLESPKYTTLNGEIRKLWSDHMQWTYATVDAFYHDQDGLQANLDRLLQNQKDLGAAIVPYYGQQAGDALSALLTTHIQQAVPVLQAAQANDQTALNQALADWYANAKDIANFLSTANPEHWPPADMDHAMEHHISQTTTYAVDLLHGDFPDAVKHYDEALNHMMDTADLLSEGIALEFPDKF
jgi:hypothetical protein